MPKNDMIALGRPKTYIDWEQFQKLCQLQCTEEEIAAWFNICINTINERCKDELGMTFQDASKLYGAQGKIALRRLQFKAAMKGDTRILTFLGKNILDQTDKTEQKIRMDFDGNVSVTDKWNEHRAEIFREFRVPM